MRKSYRFVNFNFSKNKYLKKFLERNKIEYTFEEDIDCVIYYLKTDMKNFDKIFAEAMKLVKKEKISDYLQTEYEYTDEELEQAEWIEVNVNSRFHYAEPSHVGKYKEIYYQKIAGCEDCINSYKQIDNIRMKKSIRFTGKRNIVGVLNIMDEFFISEKVKKLLEESDLKGFEIWPVYNEKGDMELKNTYQIYIQHTADFAMEPESYKIKHICKKCGRERCTMHDEAFQLVYKREEIKNMPYDIFKTKEELGRSGPVFKIIISQRMYQFFKEHNMTRELKFDVVKLVD